MAAAKKNFSGINTNVVSNSISQATSDRVKQTAATPEEAEQRANEMRTQGRKGCKLTRINIGLTPQNHKFIKTMAMASGQSIGSFVNCVIAAYRREHPEIMDQANAFLDVINSGKFSNLLGANDETDGSDDE